MQEESIVEQKIITAKDKVRNFYNKNKLFIFCSLSVLIVVFLIMGYYLHSKEKKRLLLADLYIQAQIDLSNEKKNVAKNTLVKIIKSNDETYSTLSLFLLVNDNLIENDEKLTELFDHVLNNNKFEKEIKNLIILKKAFIQSNFASETQLLEALGPLINSETLWKSHALLLLGDYFFAKGEIFKANENYLKILSLANLDNLHEQARYRLELGSNE